MKSFARDFRVVWLFGVASMMERFRMHFSRFANQLFMNTRALPGACLGPTEPRTPGSVIQEPTARLGPPIKEDAAVYPKWYVL